MTTEREMLPAWVQQEYGWTWVSEVKWDMMRHNLRCADNVLGNPAKFPKANRAALERRALEHHSFLASHCQHI